jgi:hypothetical protein
VFAPGEPFWGLPVKRCLLYAFVIDKCDILMLASRKDADLIVFKTLCFFQMLSTNKLECLFLGSYF